MRVVAPAQRDGLRAVKDRLRSRRESFCPWHVRLPWRHRFARSSSGERAEVGADAVGSWPTRISELERGLKHDTALARRCLAWLAEHGDDAPKSRRLLAA